MEEKHFYLKWDFVLHGLNEIRYDETDELLFLFYIMKSNTGYLDTFGIFFSFNQNACL